MPHHLIQNASAHRVSAGLLMYRHRGERLEVFLVHPGGPYFRGKDREFWGLPKGLLEDGEAPLTAAVREFAEETGLTPSPPYLPLGQVTQRSGKRVHAWAFAGDWKPEDGIQSNRIDVEWPPHSGRMLSIPEVDEGAFFTVKEALEKASVPQRQFIKRLLHHLAPGLHAP